MGDSTSVRQFDDYVLAFRSRATQAGRDEAFVAACLSYAAILVRADLPIIYNSTHLASLVGYSRKYLAAAAHGSQHFYREYEVPKRSGSGVRRIAEPLPSLKQIQRWILDRILVKMPISRFAKGFARGLSIRDNARFHRGQARVLSLDIADFFPSIGRARVFAEFRRAGYSIEVADTLARLCCLRDVLPQGAPTSPALSNVIFRRVDARLGGFALSRGWRYTRYADDMTFSGEIASGQIVGFVRRVLADESLTLNPAKTRLMEKHQRQEVTGVVVNNGLSLGRDSRRQLRAICYYIQRFGLNSHLDRVEETRANVLAHLHGRISHGLFLNPRDSMLLRAREALRSLPANE